MVNSVRFFLLCSFNALHRNRTIPECNAIAQYLSVMPTLLARLAIYGVEMEVRLLVVEVLDDLVQIGAQIRLRAPPDVLPDVRVAVASALVC